MATVQVQNGALIKAKTQAPRKNNNRILNAAIAYSPRYILHYRAQASFHTARALADFYCAALENNILLHIRLKFVNPTGYAYT
jgi:hypothetical protein